MAQKKIVENRKSR